MKFYAKLVPKTAIVLADSRKIQFSTLDGLRGFYSTDDAYIQNEFLRLMRADMGGITEISEADYQTEYVDKKKAVGSTQLPSWRREEFGATGQSQLSPLTILGAAAVSSVVGINSTPPETEAKPVEPAKEEPVVEVKTKRRQVK